MPSTIQFGYQGLSLTYDPAGPLPLHELLAAARDVRATLDAAERSPAPPAQPPRPTGPGTRPGRNTPADPATTTTSGGYVPPATPAEAEQRFFARYGDVVGGRSWQAVQRYLGHLLPRPASVEEWVSVAEEVRDRMREAA